jgi:tetratricopeptide (TPR) repeat protein
LELDNQIDILQDLTVKLWNYIADVHNIVGNYGTSLIAYETSLGKYPDEISSEDNDDADDVDLLMNCTVATLKLAKQNEVVHDFDKAKELYEVVLKNIDRLEGDGTYEKAAVLVYAGILSSSADLLRKAIRIFESDESLLDPEKILIPGCGQRALMYKFLSYRKMIKGDFKSAWNDITISIATFENMRKGGLRTSAQVVNLEQTLNAFENWDLHLFKSYLFQICIAKQIMTGLEFKIHTKETIRNIGILLGDIGSFDLSYHCFYCLLLSLRGDENLAANALLDLASIGNRIDDTPKEILLHEEYIRATSPLLGLLHRNILPSLISLAVQNYDDKKYDIAGKWADLGLNSLVLNKDLGGEKARLFLIKVCTETSS